MTAERRLIRWNIFLGLSLTAFVAALDQFHQLDRLEGWFYDRRVAVCQHFTPPPTDRLVHVDIDDAAIESIGKWPWPRETMAHIVDELRRAGASTLALDILFSDSTLGPPGENTGIASIPREVAAPDAAASNPVDSDKALARSLREFGSVILAAQFGFLESKNSTERNRALIEILSENLESSQEAANKALGARAYEPASPEEYFRAMHEAAKARISREPPAVRDSLEELRNKLLPTMSRFKGSVPGRILEKELQRHRALESMQRLLLAAPAGVMPLLKANDETPPLPELSAAATNVGFVNELPGSDGVVRLIPMWIVDRDRLVPQFGVAMACAYLGADLAHARIEEHRVVIPRSQGEPIIVPVSSLKSTMGKSVSTIIDIPMFGGRSWETMYDYPNHRENKCHLPVFDVWNLAETRDRIRENNHEADKGMIALLEVIDPDKSEEIRKKPPDPNDTAARVRLISSTLDDPNSAVKQYVDAYGALAPQKRQESKDRAFMENMLALCNDLRQLTRQAELLQLQLKDLENSVSRQVKGKAVLIGWIAEGKTDFHQTSLSANCPGDVVHGAIFNAIVTGYMWRRSPRWVTSAATCIVGILATAMAMRLSPRRAPIGTAVLVVSYLGFNGEVLFDYRHVIVGVAGPVLAAVSSWAGVMVLRLTTEARERARINRGFKRYIDPILVNYLDEHPEMERVEAQLLEMTVAFTDLAGFTAFTEQLRERAVKFLGRYTSRMVPIIRRNRGLVHRFMGDGLMFSYGSPIENPGHAVDAIASVLEMHDELESFNRDLAKDLGPELVADLTGKGILPLKMRAGINSGEVVVGDTGADDASDYTCLGDVTNSAARLETANKYFGTRSLLAERTMELAGGQFLLRPIGRLQVAGKRIGMMTFEPLCMASRATAEQRDLAVMTGEMVDLFLAAKFSECIAAADRFDNTFGPDKLSGIYRDFSRKYIALPPDDFNGNIVLTEK